MSDKSSSIIETISDLSVLTSPEPANDSTSRSFYGNYNEESVKLGLELFDRDISKLPFPTNYPQLINTYIEESLNLYSNYQEKQKGGGKLTRKELSAFSTYTKTLTKYILKYSDKIEKLAVRNSKLEKTIKKLTTELQEQTKPSEDLQTDPTAISTVFERHLSSSPLASSSLFEGIDLKTELIISKLQNRVQELEEELKDRDSQDTILKNLEKQRETFKKFIDSHFEDLKRTESKVLDKIDRNLTETKEIKNVAGLISQTLNTESEKTTSIHQELNTHALEISNFNKQSNSLLNTLVEKSKTNISEEPVKVLGKKIELINLGLERQNNILENITKSSSTADTQTKSYAQALQEPTATDTKKKHVLICRPKGQENFQTNLEKIRGSLDPTSLGIPVDRVSKLQGESVRIEVPGSESFNKIRENIQGSNSITEDFNIIIPRTILPKIIIYGVDTDLNVDSFRDQLTKQNPAFSDNFKIISFFSGRTGNNWILEIQPGLFYELEQASGIYLGWNRHNFGEFFSIRKCRNCLRYGHTDRFCRQVKNCPVCSEPAAEGHTCSEAHISCLACRETNQKLKTEIKTDHRNFSRACPSFQRTIECFRKNIQY